jgi:hypothetical protein
MPIRPAKRLGGAALLALVASGIHTATAQVNCETVPVGPARTDCYIGLSQIHRENSGIAAGVAQQQSDIAVYRRLTGTHPRTKWHRTTSDFAR